MNTPFFISFRYQKDQQKNRLVSLISRFSTVGIALGVMVLIIGLSAMNGFERELHQRVLSVVPHAEIYASGKDNARPLQQGEMLQKRVQNNPLVRAVSPYISFTALVENGAQLKIAQIRGIDPKRQQQVSRLHQFIPESDWQLFQQQGGIILGAAIAKQLEVEQGDDVTLLLPQQSDDGKLRQPLRHSVEVAGVLRLDGQLDHSYALISLPEAQEMLEYKNNEIHGIELALHSPFAVSELTFSELADYPEALSMESWIGKFGYMYNDIQLIRTIMYIAMVLVIGVACFNIISTLIMAVKDKQGDIAILRTLGADSRFIRRIFLWYGLQAGMKGALFGVLFGTILALNLTPIMRAIEQFFGIKLLSDGVYFVDFLPSELHYADLFWVLLATFVLSLIASLYPAMRAAKLSPAKVLSGH